MIFNWYSNNFWLCIIVNAREKLLDLFPRFFNQRGSLKTPKKNLYPQSFFKRQCREFIENLGSPLAKYQREEVSFRYELKCFPRYGLGFQSTTVPQSRDKLLHTSSNDRIDKFFWKTWITFHLEHRVVEKVLKSPSNFHTTPRDR